MKQLPHNWRIEEGKLIRHFTFGNFAEALAFINKVGVVAEKQNHHPDIMNSYNQVWLACWTHDSNEITIQDYGLAEAINAVFKTPTQNT